MTAPKPPSGLHARGRRFWRSVAEKFELEPDETELLTEIARLLDTCERLQVEDPAGVALHRARQLLGRLVAQLGLPDSAVVSPVVARAKRAAGTRWAQPRTGSQVSDAAREAARARWAKPGA